MKNLGAKGAAGGAILVMVPDPPSKGEAISHEITRFSNSGLGATNITEIMMNDAFSLLLFSIVVVERKSRGRQTIHSHNTK